MAVLNTLGGAGGGGSGGGRLKIQSFSTPGSATFTVPAGVSRVEAIVFGGGGNGFGKATGGGGGPATRRSM